jgi:lysophospholipase L1-like esterase
VGIWSALAPESYAQWVTPQENSALPVEVAEQIVVDIVGSFFLFDQLFIKSATVTSLDYLSRVSEPSSKFYPDYLEYKKGKISRSELVRRLPHVAMLGDSQSKNMYLSSIPSLFWRARTERRKNWFLDTDPSRESINSLYERLDKFTPLVATEYASSGAKVAPGQITPDFPRKLGRTRNFSGQVNQVLRDKRLPDLVMILVGNNNLNWVEIVPSAEREHPEKGLSDIARGFGENYTQQLSVLIDRAKTQDHKVAVVVFGLVDFAKYFKARQKAEMLHASNRKLYPYIGMTSWIYPSLKPAYQKNTTRLVLMLNAEMRTMVANLNRELKDCPNVRLQYSDAFSNLDGSQLELLHPMDALHLSQVGHNVFAQAALKALAPSLHFLGIESPAEASRRSQFHQ